MLEISQQQKAIILYRVTLFRACLAIALGIVILFILLPGIRLPLLGNFMGLFWLMNGIISLRWGMQGERTRRLPVFAGIIGILAGLMVLFGRPFSDNVGIFILGSVILLTGTLRILGGYTLDEAVLPQRPKSVISLGIIETVFGLLLMSVPMRDDFEVYMVVGIWALIGGFVLFKDAMRMRRQLKQQDMSDTGTRLEQMVENK